MNEEVVHEAVGSNIFVNVYDSNVGNNDRLSRFGFGIHHTGVEVYDIEYAFAGHPDDDTGVYEMTPRKEEEVCSDVKYSLTIFVGKTKLTKLEVRRRISKLSEEFSGKSYHLLNKNCNHFTQALCKDLVGDENLPGWINRLATVTSYVPFIGYVLPSSWLQPWASDATDQENDSQEPSQTVSYKRTEPSTSRSKSYAEKSHII